MHFTLPPNTTYNLTLLTAPTETDISLIPMALFLAILGLEVLSALDGSGRLYARDAQSSAGRRLGLLLRDGRDLLATARGLMVQPAHHRLHYVSTTTTFKRSDYSIILQFHALPVRLWPHGCLDKNGLMKMNRPAETAPCLTFRSLGYSLLLLNAV